MPALELHITRAAGRRNATSLTVTLGGTRSTAALYGPHHRRARRPRPADGPVRTTEELVVGLLLAGLGLYLGGLVDVDRNCLTDVLASMSALPLDDAGRRIRRRRHDV